MALLPTTAQTLLRDRWTAPSGTHCRDHRPGKSARHGRLVRVGDEQLRRSPVKARLLTMAEGWREDWRRTSEATKVVLIIIGLLFLAWVTFATWFWIGWSSDRSQGDAPGMMDRTARLS